MNDQTTQALYEGMPVYYNRTGNLRKWEDVCFYELNIVEKIPEITPIPLIKMGRNFKRRMVRLVNIVNHLNE